jgi:hypothetical protein
MEKTKIEEQASVIFLMAASYIREYGWQKTGMNEHGQARCSMGALASAYPKKRWDKNLAQLMYNALYKELNGITLTQFNYSFKNGEKVARLYERVAKKLLTSENQRKSLGA